MNDSNAVEPLVPPPPQAYPESGQLRLLSIAHFAVAGINAFLSIFALFYVLLGVFGVAAGYGFDVEKTPQYFVGAGIYILASLFYVLSSMVFTACLIYSGMCLHQLKSWKYCFAVGIALCASLLFCVCGLHNLILGVVTVIFLQRPTVKARFGAAA